MPEISAPNVLAGVIFSSIGLVGFIYGKRKKLLKPMMIGLLLMAYPYFVESTLALFGIGLAGTVALFWLGQ